MWYLEALQRNFKIASKQKCGQGTGMIFGRSEGYLMFLFMLGLLIGGCMGMLMMALCVIAKKGDDVRNGEERK